jgi:hypothetical protein
MTILASRRVGQNHTTAKKLAILPFTVSFFQALGHLSFPTGSHDNLEKTVLCSCYKEMLSILADQ